MRHRIGGKRCDDGDKDVDPQRHACDHAGCVFKGRGVKGGGKIKAPVLEGVAAGNQQHRPVRHAGEADTFRPERLRLAERLVQEIRVCFRQHRRADGARPVGPPGCHALFKQCGAKGEGRRQLGADSFLRILFLDFSGDMSGHRIQKHKGLIPEAGFIAGAQHHDANLGRAHRHDEHGDGHKQGQGYGQRQL